MKQFFAYTRVSTTRQGEQGVSLQQQKASIEQFCARTGLAISQWLEEQETAAKAGRPVFSTMLKRLRAGEAAGVVMHKIDRSARNLKDWAELGQLIDQGIEVHFSNEAVDLHSRGGRLSADIQAVVAADYIRNLREEVKKGFYGRLKQGLMPMPAPLGYLDNGAGKPKTIDPVAGPIIKQAFELYASGRFSHRMLVGELYRLGLRTKRGKRVEVNALAGVLSNPFYVGIIRLKHSGQAFKGIHKPIVSTSVFQRAQEIAAGRAVRGPGKYDFRFSRFIQCADCGRSLIAERQKGHVYYRCHKRGCPGARVREEQIDTAIWQKIQGLDLRPEEIECAEDILSAARKEATAFADADAKAAKLQLVALEERQNRLTDVYVDGALEREDFEQRKAALLMERCDIEQKLARAEAGQSDQMTSLEQKVELIKHAYLLHEHGLPIQSRDLLNDVVSNRTASGKTLMITVKEPLSAVAERPKSKTGGPLSGRARTFWEKWLNIFPPHPLSYYGFIYLVQW